ncbi:MAG: DinB family protein [Cyclobacteriaceae bacterium]
MKISKLFALLLLAFIYGCSAAPAESAGDQTQGSTIAQKEVLEAWDRMTNMVVGTSRKMPAEHFSFSPVEPLAPYGALVSHTAGANFMFAATVNLERPERPEIDTNDKQAVIKNLEESFDFIKNGIKNLSDADLNEEIEWFGRKMSRLQAILTMTDHLQREYGKNITYLRLKGNAPDQSGGW